MTFLFVVYTQNLRGPYSTVLKHRLSVKYFSEYQAHHEPIINLLPANNLRYQKLSHLKTSNTAPDWAKKLPGIFRTSSRSSTWLQCLWHLQRVLWQDRLAAHTAIQTRRHEHSLSGSKWSRAFFSGYACAACGPWQYPVASRSCGSRHIDRFLVCQPSLRSQTRQVGFTLIRIIGCLFCN